MIAVQTRASRSSLPVFALLLLTNALLAVAYYLLVPAGYMATPQAAPTATSTLPAWVLGLANGGIIVAVYGPLGLVGYWLSRRLGLPGILREKAGVRQLLLVPMSLGTTLGLGITLLDRAFAAIIPSWQGFSHPPFPLSILAAASAGIGEEIVFRLFVMSLWAFLLNLLLGRFGATGVAIWLGNAIAALAFGASHFPAVMLLLSVSSPSEVPALVLAELFLLNGAMGIIAGWQYMRSGLVAAAGVHFWADIVWHVLWPAFQYLG